MYESILYRIGAPWIAFVIFLLILLTNWLGFRYRRFQEAKHGAGSIDGVGPQESTMLGLMALMLGFTFSMALSKFDNRRQAIVEEANDISTAVLCADLYPDSIRTFLRADFKDYIEARISYYNAGMDDRKIDSALTKTNAFSARLWTLATTLVQNNRYRVSTLQMIPALNSMINIVRTRDSGRRADVPPIILIMLIVLTLLSSFLVGYGHKGKHRSLLIVCAFSLTTTIALYLILDLDRPRQGVLNLNAAEQNIIALRELVGTR